MSKGLGIKYLMIMMVFCGFLSGSLMGYFLPVAKQTSSSVQINARHSNVCLGMPLMIEERETEADDESNDWNHILLPVWINLQQWFAVWGCASQQFSIAMYAEPSGMASQDLYKQYKVYRI